MHSDLIFDVGMHRGEDTEFYLKKGFRVVAVEADAELSRQAAERFSSEIAAGRLTIVNKAIAEKAGRLTFYRDLDHPIWNTVDVDWKERNASRNVVEVEVEATPLHALFAEFGTPYYLKLDIEGMDQVALASIEACPSRPRYVSVESEKVSFVGLRREFDLLTRLGYDRFKLAPQHHVARQRLPNPPLEGRYAAHRFEEGSSGAFGEEAPGRWMSAEAAIEAYRPVFLRYMLTGDDPYLRNRYLRAALKRLGFRAGWYDTHARLSASAEDSRGAA